MEDEVCTLCSFGEVATNPCQLGEGVENAEIMFVADSPTYKENDDLSAFTSKSAKNLKKALKGRGIDTSKCYFTYAIKCPHDSEAKIGIKHISSCSSYLQSEMEIVKPKIIVPMGNAGLKMVLGKTGITKMRGNASQLEDGTIVMPMIHPNTLSRNPANRPLIQEDLNTLADLYKNGMPDLSACKTIDCNTSLKDCIEAMDTLEKECLSGDKSLEWLSFDIEATGSNPWATGKNAAKVGCISLANKETEGYIIPIWHPDSVLTHDETLQVIARLKKLLENENIKKTAQNAKFDMKYLLINEDIHVKNLRHDTMMGHYLCVSEKQGTQDLKTQAWEFTDMGGYDNELDEYRDTLPVDDRYNYNNIPWRILGPYGACDSIVALRLTHIYEPMLDANPKWRRIMDEIYIPGSYAIMEIEIAGMKTDEITIDKYQKTYEQEYKRLADLLNNTPEVVLIEREKQEMYAQRQALLKSVPNKERTPEQKDFIKKTIKYKDYKFNWGSVNQLRELFYDKMGLTTTIRTDTGELSTSDEALEELAKRNPVANLLQEWRKINTLKSMFIDKLPSMRDKDGIIHPSFLMHGTETCRLSSKEPNAQQFPRKAENPILFQFSNEPKALFSSRFDDQNYVRKMLEDDPEYTRKLLKKYKWKSIEEALPHLSGCNVNTDYSQLELRIAALISGDETFIEAYKAGKDVHKLTASTAWSVPIEEVTKDMRTAAKAVSKLC